MLDIAKHFSTLLRIAQYKLLYTHFWEFSSIRGFLNIAYFCSVYVVWAKSRELNSTFSLVFILPYCSALIWVNLNFHWFEIDLWFNQFTLRNGNRQSVYGIEIRYGWPLSLPTEVICGRSLKSWMIWCIRNRSETRRWSVFIDTRRTQQSSKLVLFTFFIQLTPITDVAAFGWWNTSAIWLHNFEILAWIIHTRLVFYYKKVFRHLLDFTSKIRKRLHKPRSMTSK